MDSKRFKIYSVSVIEMYDKQFKVLKGIIENSKTVINAEALNKIQLAYYKLYDLYNSIATTITNVGAITTVDQKTIANTMSSLDAIRNDILKNMEEVVKYNKNYFAKVPKLLPIKNKKSEILPKDELRLNSNIGKLSTTTPIPKDKSIDSLIVNRDYNSLKNVVSNNNLQTFLNGGRADNQKNVRSIGKLNNNHSLTDKNTLKNGNNALEEDENVNVEIYNSLEKIVSNIDKNVAKLYDSSSKNNIDFIETINDVNNDLINILTIDGIYSKPSMEEMEYWKIHKSEMLEQSRFRSDSKKNTGSLIGGVFDAFGKFGSFLLNPGKLLGGLQSSLISLLPKVLGTLGAVGGAGIITYLTYKFGEEYARQQNENMLGNQDKAMEIARGTKGTLDNILITDELNREANIGMFEYLGNVVNGGKDLNEKMDNLIEISKHTDNADDIKKSIDELSKTIIEKRSKGFDTSDDIKKYRELEKKHAQEKIQALMSLRKSSPEQLNGIRDNPQAYEKIKKTTGITDEDFKEILKFSKNRIEGIGTNSWGKDKNPFLTEYKTWTKISLKDRALSALPFIDDPESVRKHKLNEKRMNERYLQLQEIGMPEDQQKELATQVYTRDEKGKATGYKSEKEIAQIFNNAVAKFNNEKLSKTIIADRNLTTLQTQSTIDLTKVTKDLSESMKKYNENIINPNELPGSPYFRQYDRGGDVKDGLYTTGENGMEMFYKKGNKTKVFNRSDSNLKSLLTDEFKNMSNDNLSLTKEMVKYKNEKLKNVSQLTQTTLVSLVTQMEEIKKVQMDNSKETQQANQNYNVVNNYNNANYNSNQNGASSYNKLNDFIPRFT